MNDGIRYSTPTTENEDDDENDSDTIYCTTPLQEGFSGRNKEVGTTISMRPVVTS